MIRLSQSGKSSEPVFCVQNVSSANAPANHLVVKTPCPGIEAGDFKLAVDINKALPIDGSFRCNSNMMLLAISHVSRAADIQHQRTGGVKLNAYD